MSRYGNKTGGALSGRMPLLLVNSLVEAIGGALSGRMPLLLVNSLHFLKRQGAL